MEKITKILQNAYSDLAEDDKTSFVEWYKTTFNRTKQTLYNKFNRSHSKFTEKEFKAIAKRLNVVLEGVN